MTEIVILFVPAFLIFIVGFLALRLPKEACWFVWIATMLTWMGLPELIEMSDDARLVTTGTPAMFLLLIGGGVRLYAYVKAKLQHAPHQLAPHAPPPPAPQHGQTVWLPPPAPPVSPKQVAPPKKRKKAEPPKPKRRTREEIAEAIAGAGLDDQRRLYVEWCASRLTETSDDAATARDDAAAELAESSTHLAAAERAFQDAGDQVALLTALRTARSTAVSEDFDRTADLPSVARVEPTAYGTCIVTAPLSAHGPTGQLRLLGAFELHVGTDGALRILNQHERIARGRTLWDHPWVADGEPMLPPDLRVRVIEAAAQRRVADAAVMLIAFLTEPVGDDAPMPITAWPPTVSAVPPPEPEHIPLAADSGAGTGGEPDGETLQRRIP